MSRSSAERNETINLTANFFDAGGDPTDPTDLRVSIYPPGKHPEDSGTVDGDAWVLDATLTSGGTGTYASSTTITQIATGQYQYSFAVPADATLGAAYDRWEGTVDTISLDETFTFTIVGGGSIGTVALSQNQIVTVNLSGIKDLDGNTLDDYEFYFTTLYSPLYCTVRQMRLKIGSYINDLCDDTINFAIHMASLEADTLTWNKNNLSDEYYQFARQQWTCCRAAEILLMNTSGADGSLKSKRLGDLSVEYDTSSGGAINSIVDRMRECQFKWEGALMAGGRQVQGAKMVVRGADDPDRPPVGRGWIHVRDLNSPGNPIANRRIRLYGSNRFRNIYSRRGKGWWSR